MTKTLMAPVHPGEILKEEYMVPLSMSATALARRLGVSAPTVNDVVRGRRSVTVDTAMRLGRYFRTTPHFWMNLQILHDLDQAVDRQRDAAIRKRVKPLRYRATVAA